MAMTLFKYILHKPIPIGPFWCNIHRLGGCIPIPPPHTGISGVNVHTHKVLFHMLIHLFEPDPMESI